MPSDLGIALALKLHKVSLTYTESGRDVFPVCVAEGISLRSVVDSSSHRELLVVNCDLDPECVDSELRLALQWIAASELGLHAVYFMKCKDRRTSKVGAAQHIQVHRI